MSGEEAFLASLGAAAAAPVTSEDQIASSATLDDTQEPAADAGSADSQTSEVQIPDLSEVEAVEYDPSNPAIVVETAADADSTNLAPPSQPVSRPASQNSNVSAQPPKKPATIGGFIAEDSDEEEDANAQTNGAVTLAAVKPTSPAPAGSIPHSPVPSSVQAAVHSPSLSVPAPFNPGAGPVPTPSPVNGGLTSDSAFASSSGARVPSQVSSSASALPKTRLPNDIVGQFEDRIAEDPRGDIEAWTGLISHLRNKGKYDEVRAVYGRFFDVFPTAADQWISYARMELQLDDLPRLEAIFNLALIKVQSIGLWSIYIDHIRRRNDISTDVSGQGRQVVSQAYEFVINQVGQDKDSGQLWQDYIAFIKSGPGVAGGTGWQDAQKMDLIRKAYQRAVCVPMSAVATLWKEYDTFEMGLNKMTGRKFLQEKSPAYMTARGSYTALQNITANLVRGAIPRLPPHPGCDGADEINSQVDAWQKWIAWEKEDPLVLKEEDANALTQRILFVYKQATMALRFHPQIWFDAAQWCLDNSLIDDGNTFLNQGLEANPESCLLAFKKADRIEQTTTADESAASIIKRGKEVRAPYDVLLNTLYKHLEKMVSQEKTSLARVEERYAAMDSASRDASQAPGDDEAEGNGAGLQAMKAQKEMEIQIIKSASAGQIYLTKKIITFAWIGLMRAMRRVQGKGKPNESIGGMRAIFKEARTRQNVLGDLHSAAAWLEHNCYRDPSAPKIFNLGMKVFPEDEDFALEHMRFLVSTGDSTNARAVFETTVGKITAKPENVGRAKLLYAFFYDWESKFGELTQAAKLEKRMGELYPEDPALTLFSSRYASRLIGPPPFDPCSVRLVLSITQIKPKMAVPMEEMQALPSIEMAEVPVPVTASAPASTQQSTYLQSPKRGLEDSDAELPARKLLRGESPLKGAAGRRQQQKLAREGLGKQQVPAALSGPRPLPPAIYSLLSTIPPASAWRETRFDPAKLVDLLRSADLTRARMHGN